VIIIEDRPVNTDPHSQGTMYYRLNDSSEVGSSSSTPPALAVSQFVGSWKAGKQNGTGKVLFRNGDSLVAEWKEGVLITFPCIIQYSNGGNSYTNENFWDIT